VHAPYAMQWQVFPAPEHREVVWNNLAKSVYSRMVRSGLVYFAVFMTVLFYMIPIALISSFTTLDNLVKILPFLKAIVNYPPINTVLQVNTEPQTVNSPILGPSLFVLIFFFK
jgi:hypothetical protein